MGTLESNCVRAIDDVLSGADPFSDRAVECLQQMGRQATLSEAERALLRKILESQSNNDLPYDHNQQKQYDRLELQALRLLEREIGDEVIPFCISVLNSKVANEFYCTWNQSAPAQTLDILQIAKQYARADRSVAAAISALLYSVQNENRSFSTSGSRSKRGQSREMIWSGVRLMSSIKARQSWRSSSRVS